MICYSSCRKRIRTAQGGGGVTFQQLHLIHPHNPAALLGPRGLPFRGAGPTAAGALPANVVYLFGESVPKGPISSLNVGRGRHSFSRVWRGGRGGRCPHHCSEARATKLAAAQNRGAPACRVQFPPPTCDLDQARQTEAPPSPRALRKTADSVHSHTSQLTSSSQTPRLLTASPARAPQRAGVQIQPSPTSLNPARFCSVSARGPGKRSWVCDSEPGTVGFLGSSVRPEGPHRAASSQAEWEEHRCAFAPQLCARHLCLRNRGRWAARRPSQSHADREAGRPPPPRPRSLDPRPLGPSAARCPGSGPQPRFGRSLPALRFWCFLVLPLTPPGC